MRSAGVGQSLWSARAIAYRDTQGIDHRTVRLAVVIQVMIDAEVAGVLFTANAVTGRRHEAVIDASPGLGEAVVSGAVTPDHFVIDTATGRVLQQRTGDNAVQIRMDHAAGGTRTIRSAATGTPCLDSTQLRSLTDIGSRVERHFGSPQDIEWAFAADGTMWLTQSRPITTLFPLPDTSPDKPGLRAYFCFSVAQGLYRPLTPAGLSAFRLLGAGAAQLYGRPVVGDVRTRTTGFRGGRPADLHRHDRTAAQPRRPGLPAPGVRPDGDQIGDHSARPVRPQRVLADPTVGATDTAASAARRGPLPHSGVHRPGA